MPMREVRTKPPESLRARAIRLLARRDYSRTELAHRLAAREASREDVAELLDDLERLGYLSDARYAQAVVTQKSGQYSRRAIAGSLKAHGVARDAASEALDAQPVDDDAALVALWRRRFGRVPENEREKGRQVRFLQSRGFSLSAILKLLRTPPDAGESQGP